MVDAKENHSLYKLGLNHRAAHSYNGLTGKNRRALWNGPHITGEPEISQIFQELRAKNLPPFQIGDVLLCKAQAAEVLYQLFHTGHNGKAPIVRNLSEKHIKIADGVLKTTQQIAVGHGQLIKIGEHGQAPLRKPTVQKNRSFDTRIIVAVSANHIRETAYRKAFGDRPVHYTSLSQKSTALFCYLRTTPNYFLKKLAFLSVFLYNVNLRRRYYKYLNFI